MKYSEKYLYEKMNYRVNEVEFKGLSQDEIMTYGKFCFLEGAFRNRI